MRTLIRTLTIASVLSLGLGMMPASLQAQTDGPVFELRTYKSTPGNLEKLLTRFRDHTMRIFEKHGMTNIGYWIPTDEVEAQDTLVYLLKHDSMEAATASWRAFAQDPEWRQVNDDSNRDGAILDSVVRKYMTATDFSQMK
ncbi:MAG: NIPSNAP family protein [Pseudohongiella sp.]|nr:NIPSNAP family protein [Pseudohongiella sp.]